MIEASSGQFNKVIWIGKGEKERSSFGDIIHFIILMAVITIY